MKVQLGHFKVCEKDESFAVHEQPDITVWEQEQRSMEFLNRNRHMVRNVIWDQFTRLYFLRNEEEKTLILNGREPEDFEMYFIGSIANNAGQVKQIEAERNFELCARRYLYLSFSREPHLKTSEVYPYECIEYTTSNWIDPVLFLDIACYEDYQVRDDFFDQFSHDTHYYQKADVLKAYSLLQANAELLPVIQKQFRKDFIDNFIEGTSIFSV